jgi:hypothetical protein
MPSGELTKNGCASEALRDPAVGYRTCPMPVDRVGTFHHVHLQSEHQCTAIMVHVINLTPPGSE